MSELAGKAVFLSYASQDAGAARRVADALRAAGIEVWFDQNELVGGDAWDQKIRGQISSCALFVPMISANTQARLEAISGWSGNSPHNAHTRWRTRGRPCCRS